MTLNQFYYQKIISNEVIKEIQKLLNDGNTYLQIKQKTGVSDGTIAKIKKGIIKPNRIINNKVNLIDEQQYEILFQQYNKIRKTLKIKEDENIRLKTQIELLEYFKKEYFKLLKINNTKIERNENKTRIIKQEDKKVNNTNFNKDIPEDLKIKIKTEKMDCF